MHRRILRFLGLNSDAGPFSGRNDKDGSEISRDMTNVRRGFGGALFRLDTGATQINAVSTLDPLSSGQYVAEDEEMGIALFKTADGDGVVACYNRASGSVLAVGEALKGNLLDAAPVVIPCTATRVSGNWFAITGVAVTGDMIGDGTNASTAASLLIEDNIFDGDDGAHFERVVGVDTEHNRVEIDRYAGEYGAHDAILFPSFFLAKSTVAYRRLHAKLPSVVATKRKRLAITPDDRPAAMSPTAAYPAGLRAPQMVLSASLTTGGHLTPGRKYRVMCCLVDQAGNRVGPPQHPVDGNWWTETTTAASKSLTVSPGTIETVGSIPSLALPFKKRVLVSTPDANDLRKVVVVAGSEALTGFKPLSWRDTKRQVSCDGISTRISHFTLVEDVESPTLGIGTTFYLDDPLPEPIAGEVLCLWTEEYSHWGIVVMGEEWAAPILLATVEKELAEGVQAGWGGFIYGEQPYHADKVVRALRRVPHALQPLNCLASACTTEDPRIIAAVTDAGDSVAATVPENPEDVIPAGYPEAGERGRVLSQFRDCDEGRMVQIGESKHTIIRVVSASEAHVSPAYEGTTPTTAQVLTDTKRVWFSRSDAWSDEMADPFACALPLEKHGEAIVAVGYSPGGSLIAISGANLTVAGRLSDWLDRTLPLGTVPAFKLEQHLRQGARSNTSVYGLHDAIAIWGQDIAILSQEGLDDISSDKIGLLLADEDAAGPIRATGDAKDERLFFSHRRDSDGLSECFVYDRKFACWTRRGFDAMGSCGPSQYGMLFGTDDGIVLIESETKAAFGGLTGNDDAVSLDSVFTVTSALGANAYRLSGQPANIGSHPEGTTVVAVKKSGSSDQHTWTVHRGVATAVASHDGTGWVIVLDMAGLTLAAGDLVIIGGRIWSYAFEDFPSFKTTLPHNLQMTLRSGIPSSPLPLMWFGAHGRDGKGTAAQTEQVAAIDVGSLNGVQEIPVSQVSAPYVRTRLFGVTSDDLIDISAVNIRFDAEKEE